MVKVKIYFEYYKIYFILLFVYKTLLNFIIFMSVNKIENYINKKIYNKSINKIIDYFCQNK